MEDPPSLLMDYHSPRRSPTPHSFPKSPQTPTNTPNLPDHPKSVVGQRGVSSGQPHPVRGTKGRSLNTPPLPHLAAVLDISVDTPSHGLGGARPTRGFSGVGKQNGTPCVPGSRRQRYVGCIRLTPTSRTGRLALMLGRRSRNVNGGLVSCSEQGDPVCVAASGVGSGRSSVREGTDVRQVLADGVEAGVALNYTTSDPSHEVGDLDRLCGQRVRVVHAWMQRHPPGRDEASHTTACVGIKVMT